MTNQGLKGIARAVLRGTPLLGFGLIAAAAALAYTVHAHRADANGQAPAAFVMRARPATRVVTPGASVWYRIAFARYGYRGRIRVRIDKSSRMPRRFPSSLAPGKLRLKTRGQRVILTAISNPADQPGNYEIRLLARGRGYRRAVTVRLKVPASRLASFAMAGNAGQLWPGMSRPINVTLTNPNPRGISVRRMVVAIRSVQAPRATRALPCTTADFAVSQFSGLYPLRLKTHTRVQLSALGVAPDTWPHLTMINRPVNQNGCQGATVILGYRGTATSP